MIFYNLVISTTMGVNIVKSDNWTRFKIYLFIAQDIRISPLLWGNESFSSSFMMGAIKAHRCQQVIERFHSRGQQPCKFFGTKERFYIRKEFNSQRISLEHQHGRRFIVSEHQYGCHDVRWKRSIQGPDLRLLCGNHGSTTARVGRQRDRYWVPSRYLFLSCLGMERMGRNLC